MNEKVYGAHKQHITNADNSVNGKLVVWNDAIQKPSRKMYYSCSIDEIEMHEL